MGWLRQWMGHTTWDFVTDNQSYLIKQIILSSWFLIQCQYNICPKEFRSFVLYKKATTKRDIEYSTYNMIHMSTKDYSKVLWIRVKRLADMGIIIILTCNTKKCKYKTLASFLITTLSPRCIVCKKKWTIYKIAHPKKQLMAIDLLQCLCLVGCCLAHRTDLEHSDLVQVALLPFRGLQWKVSFPDMGKKKLNVSLWL